MIGYVTFYFKIVGNDNDIAYSKAHHDFGVFPDKEYFDKLKEHMEEIYTGLGMHVIYVETCSLEEYNMNSSDKVIATHKWGGE